MDAEIKKYKKIVSLDFELYNTMYYWSICWAGVVVTDAHFAPITAFDIRVNPVIRHRFIGRDIKFPFSGAEIRQEKLFGDVADKLLCLLDADTLVIGHAFDNDAKMLIDACHRYRIKAPPFDYVDTNLLYNAAHGGGQRSLTKIADEFGIEFTAHDPLEDARAAMEAANKITQGDICGFLVQHGIEPSRVENGLMYKGATADSPQEKKRKTDLYNLAFFKGRAITEPASRYYFEPNILAEQDLSPLLDALIQRGCSFASTPYSAEFVVTNNLLLTADPKITLLRTVVRQMGLPFEKFDFRPKRIRDAKNKPITIQQYYSEAYAGLCKDGVLNGRGVAFSKSVERSEKLEPLLDGIVQNGGRICFEVAEAAFFIVAAHTDIKNKSDSRVRAYRKSRRQKVLTAEEFTAFIQEQTEKEPGVCDVKKG
ncbi:MAG: exonuclease domain-containing protein [Firmicutes bacterium]|nr:exonuclease domain-containing protein [Bacillota bacterium]